MRTAADRHPQRGVTLVELLVTMSIGVILLTVGVAGMNSLVKRNTRAAEVNAMVGHLNFARAQAIMRARNIRVCPVDADDPAAGCDDDADGTSWVNGYAVVEINSTGNTVLRLQEGSDRLRVDSGGRPAFEFEDDGTLRRGGAFGNGTFGNGTITFCDTQADGIDGIDVVISPMGRIRLDEDPPDCDAESGG